MGLLDWVAKKRNFGRRGGRENIHTGSNKTIGLSANGRYSATTIMMIVLIILAISATASVYTVGYRNVEEFKALGAWGDFTGGLLNPILTFITFMSVIITVFLQKEELSLTREEMARSASALEDQANTFSKQAFENTFFEMLRFHSTIVDSIDLINQENGNITKGRDAFRVFYTRLNKIYRENKSKSKGRHSDKDVVLLSYHIFWRDAGPELSHYFRFLFNFFRMIENSAYANDHYGKLLRSQLSDQELLIIYYNNVTERGAPFAHFADEFELFDNLPVVKLLDKSHVEFSSNKSFGKNPMEFKPKAK